MTELKSQSVSELVSERVNRSPIELSWTAKENTPNNHPVKFYQKENKQLSTKTCQKENTPHNHPVTFYQKENKQLSTNMLSKRQIHPTTTTQIHNYPLTYCQKSQELRKWPYTSYLESQV